MNKTLFFAMILASSGAWAEPAVTVVRSTVVNDTIPNAMLPMGIVRAGKTGLLTVFCDGGDLKPGSKAYLFRSPDLGATWNQEPEMVLASAEENVGMGAGLSALPDGRLLLIEMIQTYHSQDRTSEAVFKGRTSSFLLKVSEDEGRTFLPYGSIPFPENGNGGVMGTVVALVNGDLILPGYQYPGALPKEAGVAYGSGFFRSRDGGKTWGVFEVAFADPVPDRPSPLGFNEAAYVVRPDGSIVAYARIDSEKFDGADPRQWQTRGNNLWYAESADNGKTWTPPKETSIGGIFPAIARLGENHYLLACGIRHETPTRRVGFFESKNGLDFQFSAYAPYARTAGKCLSSATGGAQSLVVLNERKVYCVYYAADPSLPTHNKTYIEGCLLRVE